MLLGQRQIINMLPGVNPYEDSTALDTLFFTNADKVRFQNGRLRKLGGWQRIFSRDFRDIQGSARNIFSYRDNNGDAITVIGTSFGLYVYYPNKEEYFYNITPLETTTTAIPNSLSTEYNSAVNIVMRTTLNSPIVTLYMQQYFSQGDLIQISNVTPGTYNGIDAAALEGSFNLQVNDNQSITITLSESASSTGTVMVPLTWAARYLYVKYDSNNLDEGMRIKISGSEEVGGIPAASINIENIIANVVDANIFTIITDTFASSSVQEGGGASITLQQQIASGLKNVTRGYGYGAGLFGGGIYGGDTSIGETHTTYPRIWSMDNINGNLILTPGDPASNSTDNLYLWQNNLAVAPVLVSSLSGASNVPLACKWVYVSSNCAIVLGNNGNANQFTSSDFVSVSSPLPINWTIGASTNSYSTIIAGSSPLITQSRCRNYDLLFTEDEVYRVEFVAKPDIWYFSKLFSSDGAVGPKARCIIEDAVFWMGYGDFYVYDGYTVNVLPNNTLKRYVYDNINWDTAWVSFAYANVEFSEVWFFYPAKNDTDPNNYVIYNYKEKHWTNGTLSRTAAEERFNVNIDPVLVQSGLKVGVSLNNNINTYFGICGNDPITVSEGSKIVTLVVDIGCYLQTGDKINIQGVEGTIGGIPASSINGIQTIITATFASGYGRGTFGSGIYGGDIALNLYEITFEVADSAISTASGGGSNVTMGTQILGINKQIAGVNVGDIISISGAAAVDGMSQTAVNSTNPVRAIQDGIMEINTDVASAFSTSNESGGGIATLSYDGPALLFQHEVGVNDYNYSYNVLTDNYEDQYAPMNSYAQTNYAQIVEGDNTMLIYSVFPDINLLEEGDEMYITVNVREYANDPYKFSNSFIINTQTRKVDPMMIGRQRQYIIGSNTLNTNFLIGRFIEEIKPSTPR